MRAFKLVLLMIVACVVLCQSDNSEEMEKKMFTKFQKFMEKYEKVYETKDEFDQRYSTFKLNYKNAKDEFNQAVANGEDLEYSVGVTQFADLTSEEFEKTFLVKDFDMSLLPENAEPFNFDDGVDGGTTNSTFLGGRNLQSIPTNWDWRNQGAVTNVKNQGSCGGCWSFSAAANIEGLYKRKYGQLQSFSVQQMIDCDYSNSGCNGGIMHNAFSYIKNNGGLSTWNNYPYIGYQNYCRNVAKVARVSGYTSAGTTNESSIMQMLYRVGPLSITMNARTLQMYKGGVYNVNYNSCPYAPDHGVTLVGYGTTSTGIPYWTIKNSWGPSWGESGYFRIIRGRGLCGVNQYVYSAILA